MTTLQKTFLAVTLTAALGTGIYGTHQAGQLKQQLQMLQHQQVPLAEQLQQMHQERDAATSRLAALTDELAKAKSNNLELMKLRGEVAQLRGNAEATAKLNTEAREALMKSWLAREDQLKLVVEQNPDKKIPDLQLLSEQDWLDTAKDAKFDSTEQIRRTLANLRNSAANKFVMIASDAVKKYMKANNEQFPTDLALLQPYFQTPISADILQRWEIVPQSAVPHQRMGGDWVITVKAPIDREFDYCYAVGPGSYGSSSYQDVATDKAIQTMKPALDAYAADHNGSQAADPAQIQPYLTTPELQAAFQTLMQKSSKQPVPQ